jgi:hypothetical protein
MNERAVQALLVLCWCTYDAVCGITSLQIHQQQRIVEIHPGKIEMNGLEHNSEVYEMIYRRVSKGILFSESFIRDTSESIRSVLNLQFKP